MSVRYDDFRYMKPPRPEKALPPSFLPMFEKRKWYGQMKKNGTNAVLFFGPAGELHVMGRHGDQLRAWKQGGTALRTMRELLPRDSWNVVNAELIDGKTPHIKDVLYVHDVLVHEGRYLLGSTYAQRYAILQSIFLSPSGPRKATLPDRHELTDYLWLARNFREGFSDIWNAIDRVEDEGLVLKNPEGKLTVSDNDEWVVKCRKTHKNYGF